MWTTTTPTRPARARNPDNARGGTAGRTKEIVMAKYTRNIQGVAVDLELIEVDPDAVVLDVSNPRLGFSIRQLEPDERTDAACTLLLTAQEEVEQLKRSIMLSGGVQE